MKKFHLPLIILFVIIVVIQLSGNLSDGLLLEYIAKPWIMILIAVYFLLYSEKRSFRTPVMLAFFFCWLGDILLMLAHTWDVLFYFGVFGFLVGQILYIFIFFKYSENNASGFIRRNPWSLLPFLIYLTALLVLLFPKMDAFMKPIIMIYGLSLLGMSVAALNRKGRVSEKVYQRVFTGSIFFVLSDSMIAINKFHTAFDYSGFLIMLTYIAAQVLILSGLVIEKEQN